MLARRLSPFLVAGLVGLALQTQWQQPLLYPWPLVGAFLGLAITQVLLFLGRGTWRQVVVDVLPIDITFFSLFAFAVMVEDGSLRSLTTVGFALLAFLHTTLLFLLLYDPTRYPVNALSHLSVALIPLANALLAWGMVGLFNFAQMSGWLTLLLFFAMNFALFAVTNHPDAVKGQVVRWSVFGGIWGVFVGGLAILLPLGMEAQAALAALLIVIPLRTRRYAYTPRPSARQAWMEALSTVVLLFSVLLLSRWA